MKKVLFISALIMASSFSAFADPKLVCEDSTNTTGKKYQVLVFVPNSDNVTFAKVYAGPEEVAQLVCSDVDGNSSSNDPNHPIAYCHEQYIADGGYSLVITDGNATEAQHVILSEVTIVGTKEIANLPCVVSWK